MTSSQCNVLYVNRYGLPIFAQRLAECGGFRLTGITEATEPQAARKLLSDAHVYQVSSGVNELPGGYAVDPGFLNQTPKLLMVSTIGAGHDTVNVDECTRRGIVVVSQSGGANAQAVVEHTMAMLLALGKRMVEADRQTRRTPGIDRSAFVGRNFEGKTVGLVGFGHVGKRLAVLCTQAFNSRVLAFSEHSDATEVARHGAAKVALPVLLQSADYVVVCCSLTAQTRGLIGTLEFAMMQRHAYFVTTARSGIHDESALMKALSAGQIAGAGVDVWDHEPPPLDHPLLKMDNVIATPHIAGATLESRIGASESAAYQIRQALAGKVPRQLLNPQVWEQFIKRLSQAFPLGVTGNQAPTIETATS